MDKLREDEKQECAIWNGPPCTVRELIDFLQGLDALESQILIRIGDEVRGLNCATWSSLGHTILEAGPGNYFDYVIKGDAELSKNRLERR